MLRKERGSQSVSVTYSSVQMIHLSPIPYFVTCFRPTRHMQSGRHQSPGHCSSSYSVTTSASESKNDGWEVPGNCSSESDQASIGTKRPPSSSTPLEIQLFAHAPSPLTTPTRSTNSRLSNFGNFFCHCHRRVVVHEISHTAFLW